MFIEKIKKKLIKIDLISYYLKDEIYYVLKNRLKNDELIEIEKNEFSKDELENYIRESLAKNSFTYISTYVNSVNQGVVNSCSHNYYKEIGIDINNIKILCIKNQFSIFIGMYDFNNLKKDNEMFKFDYLYSPFVIIYNYKVENNSAYLLTFEDNVVLMITTDKPIYGNIHYFSDEEKEESTSSINLDELDDDIGILDELDDLDDLDESIEDTADLLDDDEVESEDDSSLGESVNTLKDEIDTIEFLKSAFKDYYDNYASDFIEKIVILNNYNISDTLSKSIEKEFFIDTQLEEFNLLQHMNLLAKEDIDV